MVGAVGYRIRLHLHGELSPTWWSEVFAGLAMVEGPDGTTIVSGSLPDQAALHGLLAAIRDLGLTLISVETSPAAAPTTPRED